VRTAGYAVVLLFDLPIGAANFLGVKLKVKKHFSDEELSSYFTFFYDVQNTFFIKRKENKVIQGSISNRKARTKRKVPEKREQKEKCYRGLKGRTPRRRAIGRKPTRAQVLASSRIAGARATGIRAFLS
jgi:hypothetical protein